MLAREGDPALPLEAPQQARDDFAHRSQFIGELLVRLGQGAAVPEQGGSECVTPM